MNLKEIKELMAAMGRTETSRVRIKDKDFELELDRQSGQVGSEIVEQVAEAVKSNPFLVDIEEHRVKTSPSRTEKQVSTSSRESQDNASGTYITSPMVGTFYTSPSPESANFIKVGDAVTKDTVVCIIEAMKVMNEVKAGVEGTVVEILMENSHPVEFGTKLFRVE